MHVLCWLIMLTAAYPLWRAWRINRRTSLIQAVHWTIIACVAWELLFALGGNPSRSALAVGSYIALALTGCAAVAVLGARRPGVTAWNFVVLALLAVDLLPLAKGVLAGKPTDVDLVHLLCVAATIAVGILNYLPTRMAPAALLLLIGCALVFAAMATTAESARSRQHLLEIGWLAVACVPWVAFWSMRSRPRAASEFDRLWLAFRNRFGLVWAQRLREQFNRSAAHAGWPVVLRWQGLRLTRGAGSPDAETQDEMVVALQALMKRFMSEKAIISGPPVSSRGGA
jgi:hypothetical protein